MKFESGQQEALWRMHCGCHLSKITDAPRSCNCSAIFDGYLDDLLSFDELLMPMDGGFDAGGRPDSRGGAGPSTGGHSGGALGEDLGGFCSNCWCVCQEGLRVEGYTLSP